MKSIQYKEKENRIVRAFKFGLEFKENWPSWFLDLIIEGRVTFNKDEDHCKIQREYLGELLVNSGEYIVIDFTVVLAYPPSRFYVKYELR